MAWIINGLDHPLTVECRTGASEFEGPYIARTAISVYDPRLRATSADESLSREAERFVLRLVKTKETRTCKLKMIQSSDCSTQNDCGENTDLGAVSTYVLKKIADVGVAQAIETLRKSKGRLETETEDVDADFHLRDIKNWCSEISFSEESGGYRAFATTADESRRR